MSILALISKKKKDLTKNINKIQSKYPKSVFKDLSNSKKKSSIFLSIDNKDSKNITKENKNFTIIKGNYKNIMGNDFELDNISLYKKIKGNFLLFQYIDDKLYITTDSMLSKPIFKFESDEYICFSNNIELIMLAIPNTWEIDWNQILSFVVNSSCSGNGVLIKEIFLGRPGTQYVLRDTEEIKVNNFWSPPLRDSEKIDNYSIKNLAENLLDNISIHMNDSFKVAIPLTAGVDSRLILACALKLFPKKVMAFTHGYKNSNAPDIQVSRMICEKLNINHKFIECTENIKRIIKEQEPTFNHHLSTFGQARHSFLFDILLYESYKKFDCDLEFKGLAGGLFKGKWENNSNINKFPEKILRNYNSLFMKDFEEIILSTSNFYSQFSHQSFVNDTNENKINLSIFYTRFINRVCVRTNFQSSIFKSINPFYEYEFIHNYLRINPKLRKKGNIHLELIRYIYPSLLDIPHLASREYYKFKDGSQIKTSNKELISIGLSPFEKKKNPLKHRFLKILLNDENINIQNIRPTADWDHVKIILNPFIKSTFQKFNNYFPGILKELDVSEIINNRNFDSRLYRLYSSLTYLCYLKEKNIKFKINIH